jgi:carbon-monoxide dehydrogenase small subunit
VPGKKFCPRGSDLKESLPIWFRLNGRDRQAEVTPNELLIDFIRDRLSLTGTKRSCDLEICGACTVLMDGKAVSSCSLFAFEVNGKDLLTIEGLAQGTELHPLQESFIERGGFQCGFCTPGMILLAKALLDENPDPTNDEIREYMDANICRCTGYQMIIESILDAAKKLRRSLGC